MPLRFAARVPSPSPPQVAKSQHAPPGSSVTTKPAERSAALTKNLYCEPSAQTAPSSSTLVHGDEAAAPPMPPIPPRPPVPSLGSSGSPLHPDTNATAAPSTTPQPPTPRVPP